MSESNLIPPQVLFAKEDAPKVSDSGAGLNHQAPDASPARKAHEASRNGYKGKKQGVPLKAVFSTPATNPFDTVEWETRQAEIKNEKGETVFRSDDIEAPKSWSQLATNVVASKYFYGSPETPVREKSVRELVHRVARTLADWGYEDGYFATKAETEIFYKELAHICVNQYAAFNSPVWFNVGLHQVYGVNSNNRSAYYWNSASKEIEKVTDAYKNPQASACFIQSVDDDMEDIMRLASSEAMLFKYGSGTGTDLSTLRSSREKLSGGGTPSGPLSFMRVFDQVAAVIKSGGKTRRAAKMQSLKVSHPDILDFITCKVQEEKKAHALIAAGYDGSFNGEAYSSVMFQNANLSVRVTDDFLRAAQAGEKWQTRAVTTGAVVETLDAAEVMCKIAEAAHLCGDPGLQYDTTINLWHTCPKSAPINASNPCSEYMFVDNSACNLASINLLKFLDTKQSFDTKLFQHVTRMMIIAQDILVDRGSYPTREIAENSHRFRPLGLGYANLGALLMSLGLPYDSDDARSFAGAITALMTGTSYAASVELAGVKGVFDEYDLNQKEFNRVMEMHADALACLAKTEDNAPVLNEAQNVWEHVREAGLKQGFRNAQVTVLAPTGTIGFMMDCDTTGVEPDIALVKYKQLAGGGMFKIVNQTIPTALKRLGYSAAQVDQIIKYIDETDTIENTPVLKPEHLPVFDCAFKPKNGKRCINYHAHLQMMAAAQPFLSGAISKTINMPHNATVEDVLQAYLEGWKLGLKAVAIYRDGSKSIQPLRTEKTDGTSSKTAEESSARPFRLRMPTTRRSITHKFEVAGHQGYLTVGLYENGAPGELFIIMAKEGSTVGGIMDAFGTAISMCLQYGVPIKTLIDKFSHSRFEPSGFTKNPDIPMATSLVDYIFRWMSLTFPDGLSKDNALVPSVAPQTSKAENLNTSERLDGQFAHFQEDAPVCDQCGAITVRNGTCYRCFVCGSSMGCS